MYYFIIDVNIVKPLLYDNSFWEQEWKDNGRGTVNHGITVTGLNGGLMGFRTKFVKGT